MSSSSSIPIPVPANSTFSSLGLSDWLISSCSQMGISSPTEIQRLAIPPIIAGSNLLGKAKTGSGKTAAFALPMLHELSKDPYGIFGLVLTPTRELAFQLADQFRAFGSAMNLRDCVVVGGMDQLIQSRQLSDRPHIVIATPGRLSELIRFHSPANWKNLKFLVLDEADRLLESSFAPDLTVILNAIPGPKHRQTLLFSATMKLESPELTELNIPEPIKFVEISTNENQFVKELDQKYIFIPQHTKETYLVYLLSGESLFASQSSIIFVSTCKGCQIISELLLAMGINNVSLHSHKNQARRTAALSQFRAGISKVLVATDVASRGLDIPQVQLVVNYDLPRRLEDYIHRVGRTARAGRGGMALTVVSQYDIEILQAIEKDAGIKMSEYELVESKVLELMKSVSNAKHMVKVKLEEFDEVGGVNKRTQKRRRDNKEELKEKSHNDDNGNQRSSDRERNNKEKSYKTNEEKNNSSQKKVKSKSNK